MRRLRIDYSVCILGAVFLLILPLDWVTGMILAASFHELSHWAAIRLCGGHILSMSIGIGGAVMESSPLGRWETVICAAAGPLSSLMLLLLVHWIPRTALCGLVQGIYNLLPIYPLDGGRILRCIVPDSIYTVVERLCVFLLFGVGFFCSVRFELGAIPALLTMTALGKALARKIPCKEGKLGVQ